MVTLIVPSPEIDLILPGEDELPYDDNQTMETQRHKMQMDLLIEGLDTWLEKRQDGYVGGNMFIYYSQAQIKSQDFKGPDFFAVTGVPKRERKSWVVWQEEKSPDVVIELLSDSTAQYDKTEKKRIYQDKLRVSEYYWFDPWKPDDFAGFHLIKGRYEPKSFTEQGWLISDALELALIRWSGNYRNVETTWLRWATLEGEILPTGQELARQEYQRAEQERQRAEQERQRAEQEYQRAEQERQRAEQEHQRAEQERQRAELLANKLKELGIDPDRL